MQQGGSKSSSSHPCSLAVASTMVAIGTFSVWYARRRSSLRSAAASDSPVEPLWNSCGFKRSEVERFCRQVILPKVGVAGQQAILASRVLVVGAGGLGCPVAMYLCAAGVGKLGIVDDDAVAVSNLHRQVGHSSQTVGVNKAESLRARCLSLNDLGDIVAYPRRLMDVDDAVGLLSGYDILVDCTDAPPSRYLLNDAAVAAGRPLVAVSAVGLSGQLTIYNWNGGPCLRCIFPTPPGNADAMDTVASCEENGVLGPVPGVLGTLAALETLKLIAGGKLGDTCMNGRMLLYDSMDPSHPCRTLKIKKRVGCAGCGQDAGVVSANSRGLFCGCSAIVPCPCDFQLEAEEFRRRLVEASSADKPELEPLVVDVRTPPHFDVANLAGSQNCPLAGLLKASDDELRQRFALVGHEGVQRPVLFVCRRGNDSARATNRLRSVGIEAFNLDGGLQKLAASPQHGFGPCPLS